MVSASLHPANGDKPLPLICRIGLGLGAATLLAGCYFGFAMPQERSLTLILLAASVASFAATFRPFLQLLSQRTVVTAPQSTPTRSLTVTPTPIIQLPLATVIAPPMEDIPAASVAPNSNRQNPVQPLPSLDVSTLMRAPLEKLLLAAMLKDPEESRRLLGKVGAADSPVAKAPDLSRSLIKVAES